MCVKWVCLVLALAALPSTAQQSCTDMQLHIEELSDTLASYRSQSTAQASYRLRITPRQHQECEFQLSLHSQQQFRLHGGKARLSYDVHNDQGQALAMPIHVRGAQSTIINLKLRRQQPAPAGFYEDTLLITGHFQGQRVTQANVVVDTHLPQRFSLTWLGHNARQASVNLGELRSNKEYHHLPSLQVRSNTDLRLLMRSQNQGYLLHDTQKPAWRIGYSLAVAGRWYDLQHARQLPIAAQQSTQLLPLAIRLQDFERQVAGRYSDIIYFRVEPREL